MSTPSLVECLHTLGRARDEGQWLPDILYPHEQAQLTYYTVQAMGHRCAVERQLSTLKSDTLQAQGTNSMMVYAYCLTNTADLGPERVSLRGQLGEADIHQETMQDHCGYPDAYYASSEAWDTFKVPPLAQYHDLGRQYRLQPDEAAVWVARGVALLEALALEADTPSLQPDTRKPRF